MFLKSMFLKIKKTCTFSASACSSASLLFCMNEASAIISATFSFSATATSFVDELFNDPEELDFKLDFELLLDDLPNLSYFSASLSHLYTLCLMEKLSGQYLQTIADLYTGCHNSLIPREFQSKF